MALVLTVEALSQIMPHAKADLLASYLPFLNGAMAEFGINSQARVAAFIAQLAHESGEFRYMEEVASGTAYEGRKSLGNTQPGDGKRFKGRGPIQITGRANYERYGALLGVDLIASPTLAKTKEVAFRLAGAFWKTHGLNELADEGDILAITKKINGGTNGLADRKAYWAKAKQVLGI